MATIYYDNDCDLSLLEGKVIGIIGYGSQGHAQAQNLRDSGLQVVVAEAEGSPGWNSAKEAGFKVLTAEAMAKEADIIVMLAPDQLQRNIYNNSIEKGLASGNMLMFAHGFNIHYGQIIPPPDIDVTMIAPKCPGHMLRQLYTEGIGPPALVAVQQDVSGKARDIALAYAKGIGCTRAGVIETTFAEETETDLFGEQAILCGGVSALVEAGFNTLVEAGYQPEVAYFECLHELKLIVDLMYQGGLNYMRYSVSDTAEHGDYTGGPKIITDDTRAIMRTILADIQSGGYAEEWIEENETGRKWFNAQRTSHHTAKIEQVGKDLRRMMPWLKAREV